MNSLSRNKILKELCWRKLSYCCLLEKECGYRDNVLKKLGITKEKYKKLKKQFDDKIKLLEEK